MPGGYLLDPERRLVLTRAWGVLIESDLLAHARAVRRDPRFRSSFHQLADFRHVTEVRLHASSVRALAAENPFGPGARRALVVDSDVAYGMGRMYQILTDNRPDEFIVFRGMEAALAWLGLTPEADEVLGSLAAVVDSLILR